MVVIRLARAGSKHAPKYRIAVADSRRFVKSKYLEILGQYIPTPGQNEKKIDLDMEKAKSWIAKGAQPTDTVKYLMHLVESGKAN